MRHITPTGINLIKQFEGFSDTVYTCPAGFTTIGYGHVVQADENFSDGVTTATAEILLRQDVTKAEAAVLRLIHVPLTDGQFNALVSFTYNLGQGALQRSTLRRKVNRKEHQAAPAEFMRWVWAHGRKLPGLVKRRFVEVFLYTKQATK